MALELVACDDLTSEIEVENTSRDELQNVAIHRHARARRLRVERAPSATITGAASAQLDSLWAILDEHGDIHAEAKNQQRTKMLGKLSNVMGGQVGDRAKALSQKMGSVFKMGSMSSALSQMPSLSVPNVLGEPGDDEHEREGGDDREERADVDDHHRA